MGCKCSVAALRRTAEMAGRAHYLVVFIRQGRFIGTKLCNRTEATKIETKYL